MSKIKFDNSLTHYKCTFIVLAKFKWNFACLNIIDLVSLLIGQKRAEKYFTKLSFTENQTNLQCWNEGGSIKGSECNFYHSLVSVGKVIIMYM